MTGAGVAEETATPPKVSLTMQVETPENVVLNYQLAGPAARAAAYAIDFLIRLAIVFVIFVILTMLATLISSQASEGLFMVVLFLIEWGYYVVSEGLFGGRTIGKRALGLRVVQEAGYPITFWSALLRNLLRAGDAFPFLIPQLGFGFYGIAFLAMAVTRRNQRIGDLFARTVVITERPVLLPREPIILERIQPLPRTDIGSFVPGPRVLAKIEEFLGRRYELTHDRGHALASVLAGTLAERLDYRGDLERVHDYPMAFLARVYVTFQSETHDEEDEEMLEEPEPPRRRPRYQRPHAAAGGRR